ncbi:MAG: hypothetical protein COB29_14730 [Sulfitobacter sp.]|nr:MAG: hypothetical protein COB29_14730 [Sulfitobacter sp.]
MKHISRTMKDQSGIAVLSVILCVAIMASLAAAVLNLERQSHQIVSQDRNDLKSQSIVEAALIQTVAGMLERNPKLRWKSNGSPRRLEIHNVGAIVTIRSENNRLDVNTATRSAWIQLLKSSRLPFEMADKLTDQIFDWKDENQLVRLNGAEQSAYIADGRSHLPENRPFTHVTELAAVLNMTPELLACLLPSLTLHSGRIEPKGNFNSSALIKKAFGHPKVPTPIQVAQGQAYSIAINFQNGGSSHNNKVEIIIRLTGDKKNPFWIHEWREAKESFYFGDQTQLCPGLQEVSATL